MGRVVMANGIRGAGRAARGKRRREDFRPARGGTVRKTKLTCGVHMSAREEREGDTDGRRDSKKKAYFAEYAKAGAWAGVREAAWAGRQAKAGGAGRPAEPSGLKSEE
jgi:hypothetical protein